MFFQNLENHQKYKKMHFFTSSYNFLDIAKAAVLVTNND